MVCLLGAEYRVELARSFRSTWLRAMAVVTSSYVSVGCNQTPHCADWSSHGLLAYGAGNSIAVAKEGKADGGLERVLFMLHGHQGRVNCVRWVSDETAACNLLLLSGSVDHMVIVWKSASGDEYVQDDVLSGHSGPVNCLAGSIQHSDATVTTTVISGSSDFTVKVWKRGELERFQLVQTLSSEPGFVLGVDLCCLQHHLMLACGTDAGKVLVYVQQEEDTFVTKLSLSGHEDWVRDVHFTSHEEGCLLASCSQDCYIRLWKLFRGEVPNTSSDELRVTESSFTVLEGDGQEGKYVVTLESVLTGHEDWVYSVCWGPSEGSESPCLLSASMDKTMVMWTVDPESGLWIEQVRVGDVGGNSLGLYGAVFAPNANYILAHGYQGTFHLWKKVTSDHWVSVPTISGHYGPVQDLAWEPSAGEFLLSVSSDQTTRAHAPWVLGAGPGEELTWREIARPQIHGYNMQCVSLTSPVVFVSGADEKVIRVFQSPKNFVDNLLAISHVDLHLEHEQFPPTATVPSLGLSNKAVFSTESPITLSAVSTSEASAPEGKKGTPFEDHLQNTLWPEIHKLYGHSYEVFCVDCSPDGKLMASACIASKQEYAAILLWDTSQWCQVQTLPHHSLTVTQLAFSHSSRLLLAVSRDRTWSLWRQDKKGVFTLAAKLDKSVHSSVHSRIIWSCSWTHDDRYFVTGSRDKKVLYWRVLEEEQGVSVKASKGMQMNSAVTAIDFAPFPHQKRYLLAVGLESGEVLVYSCVEEDVGVKCDLLTALDKVHCHTAAVKRLKWRPRTDRRTDRISLASCSLDHCVRLFQLNFDV